MSCKKKRQKKIRNAFSCFKVMSIAVTVRYFKINKLTFYLPVENITSFLTWQI